MGRSEFDLISAMRAELPSPNARVTVGSGDDAAVVRAGGARAVISVDTTIDGVHARLDLGDTLVAASNFGWRSITTAVSDLAAMGVDATIGIEACVALTLPRQTADEVAVALSAGIGRAATRYGVSVVGGDVSHGPVVSVSVSVIGWASDGPLLTRAGARPGELVGVTGPIGASGAGLALLLSDDEDVGHALSSAQRERLLEAYLRPIPHLAQAAALRSVGATAAIDVSDGLVQDASHLATASGVRLRLDAAAVPLASGVAEVAGRLRRDPLTFAMESGEDFVLVVTVPREARALAEAAGVIAWIGVAEDATPGVVGLTAAGHDHRIKAPNWGVRR